MNGQERDRTFPRTVFDESGAYTVRESSHFVVDSSLIQRFAEITYARRDLETALRMLNACAADRAGDDGSLVEQSLWISAVIMYGKPFKASRGRKRFDAKTLVTGALDADGLDWHEYLLNLRDKMIAHDDSLGESKLLGLALHGYPPRHVYDVGIGGGRRRVTSMGTDIARELTPHVEHVTALLTQYESEERVRSIRELIQSGFADVVLRGPYEDKELDVSRRGVLDRFGRHRSGST